MKSLFLGLIGKFIKDLDIDELLRNLAEILYNLDEDSKGWDDAAALSVELIANMIEGFGEKNMNKVTVNALELVQYLLENIDDNHDGWDDDLALKVEKLKNYLKS